MAATEPRTTRQRKLRVAARRAARAIPAKLPPVLLLTDPNRVPDPVAIMERLPRGWGVVFRHFGAEDRFEQGDRIAKCAKRRGLKVFVSSDPKLARAIRAQGLHIPERALHAEKGKSFGLTTSSAHSRHALWRAFGKKVDAALWSTVFPSNSPSAGRSLGALRFRKLAQKSPLPIYALGGVGSGNAAQIASFGGIASIKGIADAFGENA
ncbi:MAG: thiamine phosphate synthase [Pseudomonadota bacterium]